MKNKIIFLILFLTSTASYGQINFERGYLIDNENRKIECFIKNIDWENNPREFEYKLSDNDDIKKGNLSTVKEFGIIGVSKFIRVDTKIDRSPTSFSELSRLRDPIWHQEQLFLKVLVQGKASLYYYGERDFPRFFYSVTDSIIQQLVYKEYLVEYEQIATNFSFRQQLLNDVRCERTTINSIKNIKYYQKELERYFKQYNECTGNSFVVYDSKKDREIFNLRVTPGINYSSLSISNGTVNSYNADFGNEINFRLGLEAEYILPFNKNKWGITCEPTYQYFNGQALLSGGGVTSINNQSIELSIGIRHYFFLGGKTKIFLNGFINSIECLNFDSKFKLDNALIVDNPLKNKPNLAFGVGVDYKRISAEIRYYTNQGIFNNNINMSSDYRKISFIIGYKLIKTRHNKL